MNLCYIPIQVTVVHCQPALSLLLAMFLKGLTPQNLVNYATHIVLHSQVTVTIV